MIHWSHCGNSKSFIFVWYLFRSAFCFLEMGNEHSIALNQRRMQRSPIDSLFERAVLDALREVAEESLVPSEQIEHAWDPEDCSPRFRVLSDRLTARRLPSPLTTDGIRGTQNKNINNVIFC